MRVDKYKVLRMPIADIERVLAEARDQRHLLTLARNHLLNATSEQVERDVAKWQAQIDALQLKIERAYQTESSRATQLDKNRLEIDKVDKYIEFLTNAASFRKLEAKKKFIEKQQAILDANKPRD